MGTILEELFISEGDLVFDIGAHIGSKADKFLQKGAKVICIEPQPSCVKELHKRFNNNVNVIIIGKGIAAKSGKMLLSICSVAPTISSLSNRWKKGRFSNYEWDQQIEVEVTTLDEVIQQYGVPKYCKIDVEGFEYEVLRGLSKKIPFLSFEFTIEFLDDAKKCIQYLQDIGYSEFNVAFGENNNFNFSKWVSKDILFNYIEKESLNNDLLWGDIYTRDSDMYKKHDNDNEINLVEKQEINLYDIIRQKGLWSENQPLRLHLGCGEQYLEGYVNIDFPPSEHNVMEVKADIYADILTLGFPSDSVDEIRLHHVFEHFSRVTALYLLIKWHQWLKIGGKLCIETPDFVGSAKMIISDAPWRFKIAAIRHLTGDQTAEWAFHLDNWFSDRFKHTLTKFGFDPVDIKTTQWQKEPFLSNVQAVAFKSRTLSFNELLRVADELLLESTVSINEKASFEIWKKQLRDMFNKQHNVINSPKAFSYLQNNSILDSICFSSKNQRTLSEIHGFNQLYRDYWVQKKAKTIPKGARVLDVGAGTCPYRSYFVHCDYKTHDFKKYTGEKLGGTTEYGAIDFESDITNIPVPDNYFDVILCTEVLEHVPEPIKAIGEIVRILKPDGHLLLTAPLGSGLHQLPYHYYGGFTPEWYKFIANKFNLQIIEIVPNGGFFKLLSQECARVAWTFEKHKHLHHEYAEFIYKLFNEILPRYLFELDDKCFIDQFTVGYHVEMVKPISSSKRNEKSLMLSRRLQKDFRHVPSFINLAEIEIENSNYKKAQNLLIAALTLDPENNNAKKLLEKLKKD